MPGPTYDGLFVLGTACKVNHLPMSNSAQEDAYPGITGVVSTDLGGRGRVFHVTGLLVGSGIPSVLALESALLSYADGIARVFTDTYGRAWPQTVFRGEYQPDPNGIKPCTAGFCLPYRATFRTLA